MVPPSDADASPVVLALLIGWLAAGLLLALGVGRAVRIADARRVPEVAAGSSGAYLLPAA